MKTPYERLNELVHSDRTMADTQKPAEADIDLPTAANERPVAQPRNHDMLLLLAALIALSAAIIAIPAGIRARRRHAGQGRLRRLRP